MRSSCTIATGALAVLAAALSPARATLLAYEPFTYPVGQMTGAAGGIGFSSAPWTFSTGFNVTSPVASPPASLPQAGNALHVSTPGNFGITRFFQTFIDQNTGGGDLWISHIHQRADLGFPGAQWLVLGNLRIGTTMLGRYGIGTSGGAITHESEVFAPGRGPDLLVAHLHYGAGTPFVELFLNPVDGPINPILATNMAAPWFGPTLRIEQQNVAIDATIDEIRIGTTFADVAIPGPSASLAIALGAAMLVRRRQRHVAYTECSFRPL